MSTNSSNCLITDENKLAALLSRTADFHKSVFDHLNNLSPVARDRYIVAFQAGILSLEHATAALMLVNNSLLVSAYSLMRPQFESLVRGIWLLYAASDSWVEKLGEPLTVESAKKANEGPMLAEMLKQLESAVTAPQPIVEQLKQYRDVTWKCPRRLNIEPPCRFNIEPGRVAEF